LLLGAGHGAVAADGEDRGRRRGEHGARPPEGRGPRAVLGGSAVAVPPAALASWAMRDVLGMAVIFTLPPLLAPQIADWSGLGPRAAETAAQVACPLAVQPLLAPFHILGFQIVYSSRVRLADVAAQVPGVTLLRWVRGIPPYCAGAVANTTLRFELRRAFGLSTTSVVK